MVSTLFVEPIATNLNPVPKVPGETIRALKPSAASSPDATRPIEHGDEPGGAKRYCSPEHRVEARRDRRQRQRNATDTKASRTGHIAARPPPMIAATEASDTSDVRWPQSRSVRRRVGPPLLAC